MRTDDSMLTSATSSTYIQWIVLDKLGLSDKEWKTYNFLINSLAKIEFIWVHPRDENRALDGLELRSQFSDETGYFLDGTAGLPVKCTMLEMMAALSIKVENRIMRNLSIGDRTSIWFLSMIHNMGFDKCTNKGWKYEYEDYICETCKKFINRDYKSTDKWGLFPLKNDSKNWVNEEIWVQCMAWIRENYPNDDTDLELYSGS